MTRRATMDRTRHDNAALFTYKRAVVDKVRAKFKTRNPADLGLDKLDSDCELLKRTTPPEGSVEKDEECATSVVAEPDNGSTHNCEERLIQNVYPNKSTKYSVSRLK